MRAVTADVPRPGLRERKKQMTRQGILDAAEHLFSEHGYEGVTVAQIADRANVSVKTLFKYFDSKEDLVFAGEADVQDALCDAVREREVGQSPLDAVRVFLKDLAAADEHANGIEAFHTAFGGVPQLRARLLLMYERFEQALAHVLAEESESGAGHPAPRLVAAQLISLFRLVTSEEARERVASASADERLNALNAWIDESAALLAEGLAGYGIRTSASAS
ncbi:TetR/AcrR family transcriptional regulator [Streptomyces sp. NPDC002387]|uniref:TetR/AcrR family transcriptional regulator n=1 Tax=Streptomyces TaxID=1883 RepID=UPI0031EFC9B2